MSEPGPEVKGMIVVDDWVDESVLGAWHFVTPEEVVAVVRRGVESGTIKGKIVEWCEEHRHQLKPEQTMCDHRVALLGEAMEYASADPEPCRITTVLVIPVSDGGSET